MTCRQGVEVVQFCEGGNVGAELEVAVVVPVGETTVFSSAKVAKGRTRNADVTDSNTERRTMKHRPFYGCCRALIMKIWVLLLSRHPVYAWGVCPLDHRTG
jgi:hypothetical protein